MKLDVKNILIVILGGCLIISFMLGKKIVTDEAESKIKLLHEANKDLLEDNDSLFSIIIEKDIEIEKTNKLLEVNNNELEKSRIEIKRLKNEKNKIYPITKRMSADNVAITFSKYLDKRTEGKDICK